MRGGPTGRGKRRGEGKRGGSGRGRGREIAGKLRGKSCSEIVIIFITIALGGIGVRIRAVSHKGGIIIIIITVGIVGVGVLGVGVGKSWGTVNVNR